MRCLAVGCAPARLPVSPRRLPARLALPLLAVPMLILGLLAPGTAAAVEREPALLAVDATGVRVETAAGSVTLPHHPGLRVATVADLAPGAEPAWVAAGTEARDGGQGLAVFVAAGNRAGLAELPAPGAAAPVVAGPQVLHSGGALRGLAWLEGAAEDRLAVRYAPWNGVGWGAAETVAAPGPGSQLAVSAARLDDGATLLAWSRFDGHDDEIYWSLRRDGAWSAPRRLEADDALPDVTPAVTAVPGGALAAWSAFTGTGYRVFAARFDGTAWSAARPVAPPGSAFPSFEADPSAATGVATLLYRTTRPRGWAVAQLGADLTPLRRATTATTAAATARPKLVAADGAGPVLRWTGDGETTAGERRALRWREADDRSVTPGDRR